MSDIKHILLIPTEGDPHKLLGDPESAAWKCGARPPKAWRCDGRYHRLKTDHGRWFSMSEAHLSALESGGDALVLAWDGEPVAEGCLRVGWRDSVFTLREIISTIETSGATALAWLRQRCIDHNLGTLVLLDAEGREVSDD